MTTQRTIAPMLVSLLIGALLCVLVSWGLTLHHAYVGERDGGWITMNSMFPRHFVQDSLGNIGVSGSHFLGESEVWVTPSWAIAPSTPPRVLEDYFPSADRISPRETDLFGPPPYHLPGWAALPTSHDSGQLATFAFGWPARALSYVQETKWSPGGQSPMLVTNPGSFRFNSASASWWNARFPTHPCWPGALTNTLLYGLLTWCALYGWRRFRSHRRRRLNLCPHCAYDLRATPPPSPCPECGHAP